MKTFYLSVFSINKLKKLVSEFRFMIQRLVKILKQAQILYIGWFQVVLEFGFLIEKLDFVRNYRSSYEFSICVSVDQ